VRTPAFAVLLALVAAGCGASGEFSPRTADTLTVATSSIPSPGFWEGTAARPSGGLEYELARAFARRFGLRTVRVQVVPFARLVAGDLEGADLAMALLTPTEEREGALDFSAPYLDAAPTVLTRGDVDVPDLHSAQELRWGAVRATTFEAVIADAVRPVEPPRQFDSRADALGALEAGEIDALLLDLPLAVAIAARSGGRLRAAAKLPMDEQIAAALPEGSGNAEAVSSALRRFVADGTIERLQERWLGEGAADAERHLPLLRTDQ
jgi:polar amino acid transport system substrate-binding protein